MQTAISSFITQLQVYLNMKNMYRYSNQDKFFLILKQNLKASDGKGNLKPIKDKTKDKKNDKTSKMSSAKVIDFLASVN